MCSSPDRSWRAVPTDIFNLEAATINETATKADSFLFRWHNANGFARGTTWRCIG